jgi:hypothetical protein
VLWNIVAQGRQRNRGPLSVYVRGVSRPSEGPKNLTFLFRSRVVCTSLLHLRSSWNSANFGFTAFYEVQMQDPG